MATRASIKRQTLKERAITVAIGSPIAFVVGVLLLMSPIARLGWLVWMGAGFYSIGLLAGVDDWISYLSGHCPKCSKLLRAEFKQKQLICSKCHSHITIRSQDGAYQFDLDAV